MTSCQSLEEYMKNMFLQVKSPTSPTTLETAFNRFMLSKLDQHEPTTITKGGAPESESESDIVVCPSTNATQSTNQQAVMQPFINYMKNHYTSNNIDKKLFCH